MDVYRQASAIVCAVREGHGTAKALCLRKEMQKKKQTYAVVCETLRHYELLQDVLEQAEFFVYYPRASRDLAVCMAYDAVLGKGVHTHRDSTAQAIQKSTPYLREAYWHVQRHHVIPPRATDRDLVGEEGNGSGNGSGSGPLAMPRYALINTLKTDEASLLERLGSGSAKRPRDDESDKDLDGNHNNNNNNNKNSSAMRRPLPPFVRDAIVPRLLVFPPGTDLHAHPAVRRGHLVLQDRASCLPACVLLGAVEVEVDGAQKATPKPLEYVIDACAAPGNKTVQLAALGAPGIKIMAVERDERRAALLQSRVQSLGAADYVNAVHMDFFQLASDDRDAAEAILLDPSCSASGVLTRVDVALLRQKQKMQKENKIHTRKMHNEYNTVEQEHGEEEEEERQTEPCGAIDAEAQGAEFASNTERVQSLARLQRKLLAHALLSFAHCRTVVYSTCSVHEEENEGVVRQVLEDERVQARGWTLSHIMPTQWKTRGHRAEGDVFPLEYTIRCDPETDATNGFYVARFDRDLK